MGPHCTVHTQYCGYWCPGAKHQAISIQSDDYKFIILDQFHSEILHLQGIRLENKIMFWKENDTEV